MSDTCVPQPLENGKRVESDRLSKILEDLIYKLNRSPFVHHQRVKVCNRRSGRFKDLHETSTINFDPLQLITTGIFSSLFFLNNLDCLLEECLRSLRRTPQKGTNIGDRPEKV